MNVRNDPPLFSIGNDLSHYSIEKHHEACCLIRINT